jgi:hypothetical protein
VAQWVKLLASKPGGLSSIPETPLVKKEPLTSICALWHACTPPPKVNVKGSEPLTFAPSPVPPSPTLALSGSASRPR